MEDPVSGESYQAVKTTFNQRVKFVNASDSFFELPMYMINTPALNVWQNYLNAPDWQYYINLLYSVVLQDLGRGIHYHECFTNMRNTKFTSASFINDQFIVANPIQDPNIVNALYDDPYYGLNNPDNYLQWNLLNFGQVPQ